MARLMALCSLPRTNPGNRHQYKRGNGPYKLPYGNLPRLLIAWVCTEAVRTQSRELLLDSSLSEPLYLRCSHFMGKQCFLGVRGAERPACMGPRAEIEGRQAVRNHAGATLPRCAFIT